MLKRAGAVMPPSVVAAASVVIGWLTFARSDLSLDEGYSLTEAKLPASALAHVIASRELNGSLHTALLWILRLGDASPWVVRGLSVAAGVAAVFVLYDALRRFGAVAATFGCAMVFFNPDALLDMVNGRGYALALLLVAAGLNLTFRTLETRSRRTAIGVGVLGGISIYAHFFAALGLLAVLTWLVVTHRRTWPTWGGTLAPGALLAVPALVFAATGGLSRGQLPPSPPRSVHDLVSGALDLVAGGGHGHRAVQLLAVVAGAVLVVSALRSGSNRSYVLLGALGMAGVLVVAALAARSQPAMYSTRYLCIDLPLVGLAVAASLGSLSARPRLLLGSTLVGCVLVASSFSLRDAAAQAWVTRHPWTAAARAIARETPGLAVTTVVPFEAQVARIEFGAASTLQFSPSRPTSTESMLDQSSYRDRPCLAHQDQWVLTTMSPDLKDALGQMSACGSVRVTKVEHFGPVTAARLQP